MTPLEMDDENPRSVATTYDDQGDDYDVSDQLPSVEQYKMDMANGSLASGGVSSRSGAPNTTVDLNDVYLEQGGDGASMADSSMTGPPPAMESEHDQLPSPEEVRATHVAKQKPKTHRCAYIMGIIFCVVLLLIAIIVPSVVLSNDSTSSSKSSASDPDSSRITEVRAFLDKWQISSAADLDRVGSPQNLAMHWIADEDKYRIRIPNLAESIGSEISNPFEFQKDLAERSNFIERYGLAVMFYSLGGPNWRYRINFLDPTHVCDWNQNFLNTDRQVVKLGVTRCLRMNDPTGAMLPGEASEPTRYVQSVIFPSNNIRGTIPNEIRLVHRLKTYVMRFSAGVVGQIPDGMRELKFLERLELQYCNLSGGIPTFIGDHLKKLRFLGLSNNLLVGEVPANIAQLTDLQVLGLDDNSLRGDISIFANMDSLQSLYLEDNLFAGSLTDALFNSWTNMQELDLSNNIIQGLLPTKIFFHPQLQTLDLHKNQFNGVLPSVPVENKQLKFVALFNNSFTGGVPDSINNLVNLGHLDVSRNSLSIPLPASLGEIKSLKYLFAGDNQYPSAPIPDWIQSLTLLEELSLKDSRLTGTIPTWIGGLNKLQLLDLDTNGLNGAIPGELGLISGLDHLLLNRNNFTGPLPTQFGLLRDLDVLLIDDNSITGTADVICGNPNINATFFSADCSEITCTCCTKCCDDANVTCNNVEWAVNLDPIWEYGYIRRIYAFSQEPVPLP